MTEDEDTTSLRTQDEDTIATRSFYGAVPCGTRVSLSAPLLDKQASVFSPLSAYQGFTSSSFATKPGESHSSIEIPSIGIIPWEAISRTFLSHAPRAALATRCSKLKHTVYASAQQKSQSLAHIPLCGHTSVIMSLLYRHSPPLTPAYPHTSYTSMVIHSPHSPPGVFSSFISASRRHSEPCRAKSRAKEMSQSSFCPLERSRTRSPVKSRSRVQMMTIDR